MLGARSHVIRLGGAHLNLYCMNKLFGEDM